MVNWFLLYLEELEKLRKENLQLKIENEELKRQRDMNYNLYMKALKRSKV